eukprot:gene16452-31568_t
MKGRVLLLLALGSTAYAQQCCDGTRELTACTKSDCAMNDNSKKCTTTSTTEGCISSRKERYKCGTEVKFCSTWGVKYPCGLQDKMCERTIRVDNGRRHTLLTSCGCSAECGSGFFQAVAPTETRDRTCQAQPTCAPGQYYVDGGTARQSTCNRCAAATYTDDSSHRDTACKKQPTCGAGTAYVEPKNKDGKRQCSPCGRNEYQRTDNHMIGTCAAKTMCTPGEYEISPGDATSDRVCGTHGVCSSTQYESQAPDASNDRECKPGMFMAVDATPTSDRVCGECRDGTFTETANQPGPCTRTSPCSAGERVVKQATRTNDNVCGACPLLTFQSASSHVLTECIPQTACAQGTSLPDGDSVTEQAVCTPCEPLLTYMDASSHQNAACFGQPTCGPGERYVDSGVTIRASCERCPSLSYQPAPAGHREQECTPQPPCTNGTYYLADAAAAAVRECRNCTEADLEADPPVVGTFIADTSHYLAACVEHQMCGEGQYELENSTTISSERQCFSHDECSTALEYESRPPSSTSDRLCGLLSDCVPGERVATAPTETSDRECVACDQFTWQDMANQDQCRPMSVCGVGEAVSVEGTPASDVACGGCTPGTTFQDEADHRALACKPVRKKHP